MESKQVLSPRQSDRPSALGIRLAYLGVLLLATLSSHRWGLDLSRIGPRLGLALSPSFTGRDFVDGARNVLLFAGWGLTWVATSNETERRGLLFGTVTGGILSLFIETVQLLFTNRTPSVLDLLTNVTGAFIGAGTFLLAVRILSRERGKPSYLGLPLGLFALCYGTSVFAEALIPLYRQELAVPGLWGGPARRFMQVVGVFEWKLSFAGLLTDGVLFIPAGFFLTAWLVEARVRSRRAVALATVSGVALAAIAELGHGFLGLPILPGAVLTHAVFSAGGAVLAAWAIPRFSRRYRGAARSWVAYLVYSPILMVWAWRPYRLEPAFSLVLEKLGGDWWKPLDALGMRMDMFSVIDIVIPFFLYLPLGALLAVWPLRSRGPFAYFFPALLLAFLGEFGQLFLATRTLDVTDVLVPMAGAAVGWVALRRAGFRPYGTVRTGR